MEHPVVAPSETKERVLYVNTGFTSHIEDMDAAESKALLQELYRTAWNPKCNAAVGRQLAGLLGQSLLPAFAASDYYPDVR